jgi:hypothetical protein
LNWGFSTLQGLFSGHTGNANQHSVIVAFRGPCSHHFLSSNATRTKIESGLLVGQIADNDPRISWHIIGSVCVD